MTAFTDAFPGQPCTLSGTEEEGFDTLYGIPAIALGEECALLMASGHIPDRAVLAVTNAYHRRVWGHRILPSSKLADLTRLGTKRITITVTKGGDRPHLVVQRRRLPPRLRLTPGLRNGRGRGRHHQGDHPMTGRSRTRLDRVRAPLGVAKLALRQVQET